MTVAGHGGASEAEATTAAKEDALSLGLGGAPPQSYMGAAIMSPGNGSFEDAQRQEVREGPAPSATGGGGELPNTGGVSTANINTLLSKAMNQHVSLRFVKAGGVAHVAYHAAVDVIIFLQPRPESSASASSKDRSGNNGAFVYMLDMSLPKALEKAVGIQLAAEAAAEAKSRHIAFMSHEIRNPVNGILASVEAIDEMLPLLQMHRTGMAGADEEQSGLCIAEVEDLVHTTLACTEQLRRTVDTMLDLNKLEEGGCHNPPKDVIE